MKATEDNRLLAAEILAALHAAGVRTVCLCPGGRNAPLVAAFDAARDAFDVVSFCEERSAAFFALGRIRRDRAPAAVVTTSGTAAAELLPAMLEAAHTGLRLIAVTADRPRRFRGTGAPQTVDQTVLFTATGAPVIDVDVPGQPDDLPATAGPIHLNVCFEEPLGGEPLAFSCGAPESAPAAPLWMDEQTAREVCGDFFARVRNPLVMASSLDPDDAAAVAPWLASLSSPLYLEAISQLRGRKNLQEFSLHAGERILLAPECRAACDGIVRLGGVPTPRFWRECDDRDLPALHVSRVNLPGLARRDPVVPLTHFIRFAESLATSGRRSDALFRRDRAAAAELESILHTEPLSEAGLVRALAQRLPNDARIFLGNSLPIREWDLAAPRAHDGRNFYANRGVNGIDGLVSTALGLAGSDRPTAAVIGDLSAVYDLAGLWPARQPVTGDVTIAVVNNGGGRIFDRMFKRAAFRNAHGLALRGWAEMFGWHYGTMHRPDDPLPAGKPCVVEVFPDTDATARFQDAHAAIWR